MKTESGHMIQLAHLNMGDATGDIANADSAFLQARCCAASSSYPRVGPRSIGFWPWPGLSPA